MDLTRSDCSLTLSPIQYTVGSTGEKKLLEDGEVTIYRVSDLVLTDNQYEYDLSTGQVKGVTGLDNLTGRLETENQTMAAILCRHLSGKTGTTRKIAGGSVSFTGLTPGLYLVVMSAAGTGDVSFASYFASIPYLVNGKYVYQLTAAPKPLVSEPKTSTSDPDKTDPAKTPSKSGTLPKTGQLWWPVWGMSFIGIVFVLIGIIFRASARKAKAACRKSEMKDQHVPMS